MRCGNEVLLVYGSVRCHVITSRPLNLGPDSVCLFVFFFFFLVFGGWGGGGRIKLGLVGRVETLGGKGGD
jgi:hypothetical protein